MPAAPFAAEAWFLVVVLGMALLGLLVARLRSKQIRHAEDDARANEIRRLKQQADLILATSGDVLWELDVRTGMLVRQGIQRIAGNTAPDAVPLAKWREES
ncbi:hypothetical protein, partial [Ramlibacter alkalitolerans]